MTQKRTVNKKLNLLKGFACMGVVFIHITFPGLFGQIVLKASAYAVPVFFMISGYYAFGKKEDVIKRRMKKIIRILIYAYLLYFLYMLAFAVKNHELSSWIARYFNLMTPIKYICFCTIDFAVQLWYLIAMIEVYIFWLFVVKKGKENTVVKIFPVLFVLQVLLSTFCETKGLDWFWDVNFITRGLSWFLLGYYLNTKEADKLKSIGSPGLILIALIGCILAVIPTAFDLPVKFNVIGYIPYALGLFLLALKDPGKSICRPMEFIGEKLSLNIYILHVFINDIVVTLIVKNIFKIDLGNIVYLWCRPIIVLIVTILASWILYILPSFLKKRSRN